MSEYGHIGDYDIFVCGEWLTTFYQVTLGQALYLANNLPCSFDDIDVFLRV